MRRGDRVHAGMARAKAQGKNISRPSLPETKKERFRTLKKSNLSLRKIAVEVGVTHVTVANVLKDN